MLFPPNPPVALGVGIRGAESPAWQWRAAVEWEHPSGEAAGSAEAAQRLLALLVNSLRRHLSCQAAPFTLLVGFKEHTDRP